MVQCERQACESPPQCDQNPSKDMQKKKKDMQRPHRADDIVPASKRMARATGQRTEQVRVGWRSSRQRAKTLLLLCRSFIAHDPLK